METQSQIDGTTELRLELTIHFPSAVRYDVMRDYVRQLLEERGIKVEWIDLVDRF